MAYTLDQIANLKDALASGALKVRFADGRETTFRSLKEIKQIISDAEGELATANGTPPIRRSLARFSSGF